MARSDAANEASARAADSDTTSASRSTASFSERTRSSAQSTSRASQRAAGDMPPSKHIPWCRMTAKLTFAFLARRHLVSSSTRHLGRNSMVVNGLDGLAALRYGSNDATGRFGRRRYGHCWSGFVKGVASGRPRDPFLQQRAAAWLRRLRRGLRRLRLCCAFDSGCSSSFKKKVGQWA